MKSRILWCVTLVTLVIGWGVGAVARPVDQQVPMTFKTQLTPGSTYRFTFSLYDAQTGGTRLWTEGPIARKVAANRMIAHTLGTVTSFAAGVAGPVDFSQQLWVQVVGGGKTFRTKLTAIPYALSSGSVPPASITSIEITDGSVAHEDLVAGAVSAEILADGTALAEILDNDGAGSALDADLIDGLDSTAFSASVHDHDAFWRAGGNAATTAGTDFVGTTDNQPLELWVNGKRALRLEPYSSSGPGSSWNGPNLVGGHPGNTIDPAATASVIAGGGTLGAPNLVYDSRGFIGGGYENVAGRDDGDPDGGDAAAVGGGYGNRAEGAYSVVAGGDSSVASGDNSAIGGGLMNRAEGARSVVAGGDSSVASGERSAVGGGWTNRAEGFASAVPGGIGNRAGGQASLAAGDHAGSATANTFVWGDGSANYQGQCADLGDLSFPRRFISCGDAAADPPVPPTPNALLADKQFWVQASGGVFFVTGESAGVPQGLWLNPVSQAWETIPGPSSDRAMKQDFNPVDGAELLRAVAALQVQTWAYKADREGVRHVGPMAQDFKAAFGVGEDGRRINPIDAAGVSLAAIQELHRLVQGLQSQVAEQGRRLEASRAEAVSLRSDLAELRTRHAALRLLLTGRAEAHGADDLAAR